MADELPGTPTTDWQRLTPGPAASQGILDQVIAQAAAAAASAASAQADAAAALAAAQASAISASNAEAAAVNAAASAVSANDAAAAAAASAQAAADAAEALAGGVAGQIRVQKAGGALSVVENIDLLDGLFLEIDGNTARVRTPIVRGDVDIEPGAMSQGDVITGTTVLGALSAIRRVQSTHRVWVRLYERASDRTADSARSITEDPTTPIVADIILDSALDVFVRRVIANNADIPFTDDIYYSITLLEVTGGDAVSLSDSIAAGSPTNLSSTTPTGSPQDFDYEYTGAAGDFLADTFGLIIAANGSVDMRPLRANVDVVDDGFHFWIDFWRFGVDQNADIGGFCFNVPDTPIGSYDDFNYYRVAAYRESSLAVTVRLEYVNTIGGVEVEDEALAVSLPTSSGRRIGMECDGLAYTVYVADDGDGANRTDLFSGTLANDLRNAGHTRVGPCLNQQLASSGILPAAWNFTATAPETVSPTVTITRTKIEEAE